jgi:hypothetical protein
MVVEHKMKMSRDHLTSDVSLAHFYAREDPA